mgnify:CR=1 FL=1
MNTENFRAFIEVTATGSFQKASEHLHITQSTVSARIKALEQKLNRELFTRKRDGVALNGAGKAFYPYALSVVKTWQQAQQEVTLPAGIDGIVSLGIPIHYWSKIYSDWLDWMNTNAQNVATHIQSDYSVYLLQELSEGLLDVSLVFETKRIPGLYFEPLFTESLVLMSTEPRSIIEAHQEGYIYIDWGLQFQEQHNREFPEISQHRITLALESQALEHCLTRGGSAYFARTTAQPLIDQQCLYPVDQAPIFNLTISLAVAESKRNDPIIQKAIQGLKENPFIKSSQ